MRTTAGLPFASAAFAFAGATPVWPVIAAAAEISSSVTASRASTAAFASASTSPSLVWRGGMGRRSGSSSPITVHFKGSLM